MQPANGKLIVLTSVTKGREALHDELDRMLEYLQGGGAESALESRLAEYVTLNEQIKAMTKELDILKVRIRKDIGDVGAVTVGNYAAMLQHRTLTSFDKEALLLEHGEAFVAKYTKTSTSNALIVQRVK